MLVNKKNDGFGKILVKLVACFCLLAAKPSMAEPVSLVPRDYANSLVRVKTLVNVEGSLQLEDLQGKQFRIPMQADAELFFDEMGLAGEFSPAVRHYWDAKADLTVDEVADSRSLRQDRQLIMLANSDRISQRYWSAHGMLTRQELDILDVPASAFPPELLLPNKTVEQDETWSVPASTAQQLLRLSEVRRCELTSKILEVSDDRVKVELTGTVEGTADGAVTKIELRGNYHFDRADRLVTWFAMAIGEEREIGFAAPGFKATAKIRSARQAIERSDAIPASYVEQLTRQAPGSADYMLEFDSTDEVHFRAALDRNWHFVKHQKSSAMLRYVDEGDLLATCKLDRLNRLPTGNQITLSGFQADVQSALGENCQEILSASQSVNPQGVRMLRVAAGGEVKETPIRWVYYHLSDDEGQRLSMIFTFEASLESRLSSADEALTSSISILPRSQAESARQARAQDVQAR